MTITLSLVNSATDAELPRTAEPIWQYIRDYYDNDRERYFRDVHRARVALQRQ